MTANQVLPLLSSAIMLTFVIEVLRRWWRRRSPYLLVWAVGLTMFGVGSFAEVYSNADWNPAVFGAWYLFGAMLNAAWLGQGTVYLLARRPVAHATLGVLIAFPLVGLYGMTTMSLDASAFSTSSALSDQYRDILPEGAWVRGLTPLFNVYGLLTLVGGAIYSAWLFWRKGVLQNRMWGCILIAVGAIAVGSASALTRLGIGDYLYLGELMAAILIFAGFIRTTRPATQPVREESTSVPETVNTTATEGQVS